MHRGLPQDLELIGRQYQARRRAALGLMLAGGASLLSGRAFAADCTPTARETPGPFPANGSNSVRGSKVNVLQRSGILRSDIRSSFGGSATTAPGVPLALTFTLQSSRRGCASLAGHAIYVWQADRNGEYSLYQGAALAENYLRGVQVADASGKAAFVTIFPPCYGGRYPHIHFEVYTGSDARSLVLTSQIAMPADRSAAVYQQAVGYSSSRENFARMSVGTDGVFRDNTAAQIAAMTPQLSGDPERGFTGEIIVAV
jgi:protocatechuate 3,4-dioxygenase beta subunit